MRYWRLSMHYSAFVLMTLLAQLALAQTSKSQIVVLGTGNPRPTPATMGPSVAIIVNQTPYLVDAGVGLVRRATEAREAGIVGLEMPKLQRVFLTHLHSD